MNWTAQDLEAHRERMAHGKPSKITNANDHLLSPSPGPKPKRRARHGSLAAGQTQGGYTGRFLVCVTSYRRRLLDEDNLVAKWHIDALRYAGILPSDAPGIAKIEVAQIKVKSKAEERTEISIISP